MEIREGVCGSFCVRAMTVTRLCVWLGVVCVCVCVRFYVCVRANHSNVRVGACE